MTPGASQTVLTNGPAGDQPGVYLNLASGQQVLLREMCFGVNTASDSCYYELGVTSAANGGGTFTPITPRFYIRTGAAPTGRSTYDKAMNPPPCLKYSDGVRSITYRVEANDANCEITAAFHGWLEDET